MSVETLRNSEVDSAFRPDLLKGRFAELKSWGYTDSKSGEIVEGIFARDLSYYFLEQFAREKIVSFSYKVEEKEGEAVLVSPRYEKFGDVSGFFANSVSERKNLGKPVDREEAEFAGVIEFRDKVVSADSDLAFVLTSPPPPADERHLRPGYGDYSFTFLGKYDAKQRELKMFAWRHDMDICEQAKMVNEVLGYQVANSTWHPNDFLRTPAFSKGSREVLEATLSSYGFPIEDLDKTQDFGVEKYQEQIGRFAQKLSRLVSGGADDDTLKNALASIEMEFVRWVNGEIPVVRELALERHLVEREYAILEAKYSMANFRFNSCGASALSSFGGSQTLPGLVSIGITGAFGVESEPNFDCPKCNGKIDSGKGITTCPHCGFTKERAAREMGVSC